MSACARSASSLRSQCTWLPRPTGTPKAEHLDDAAERVAFLRRGLDRLDHRRLGRRRRSSGPATRRPGRGRQGRGRSVAFDAAGPDAARRATARRRRGARSSSLAMAPAADPGGGLAGRGPLEHVAGVGEAVLLHAGQVGVPGSGLGQRLSRSRRAPATSPRSTSAPTRCSRSRWRPASRACARGGCRPAAGARPARTASGAPAEARGGAGPARPGCPSTVRQPGRQPLDDDDERLAVGLTCGQEPEHPPTVRAGPSRPGGLTAGIS